MASSADSKGRRLASRMQRLGTETAYTVAAESRELAMQGKTIYPFHIGDLNIKTPEHIGESLKKHLDAGKTGYCDAAGIQCLREAMAQEITKTRGVAYSPEEVSVQPGGKIIINKFLSVVMEEGDEVLFPSPGYPIYESQINFLGGVAVPYSFKSTEHGFELDMDYLRNAITPRTKILIFNNYQNPFGCASPEKQLQEIAELCVQHDLWVLSDEAYFDLVFDTQPMSIVAMPGMKDRTLILYTFSKSFSMTGWRLAAAIGPKQLVAGVNRLNNNLEACTNHFVQFAGHTALTSPLSAAHIEKTRETLKSRRDLLVSRLNKIPGFKAFPPVSTFYVMCNVTRAAAMIGCKTAESFRQAILKETGVSFCTRDHFGSSLEGEKEVYIRFAYSGIDNPVITEAMTILQTFMEKFVVSSDRERPLTSVAVPIAASV